MLNSCRWQVAGSKFQVQGYRYFVSNIVEGYGRKRYKADFVKFLVYMLIPVAMKLFVIWKSSIVCILKSCRIIKI